MLYREVDSGGVSGGDLNNVSVPTTKIRRGKNCFLEGNRKNTQRLTRRFIRREREREGKERGKIVALKSSQFCFSNRNA